MIYSKTELGQSALKNRSHGLTPRQRSALIMFDGSRNVQDVFKATAGLGVSEEDVAHLVEQGLLAATAGGELPLAAPAVAVAVADVAVAPEDAAPSQSAQDHYSKAYPIAARLTAELGLRGFRLNLAVEGAGNLAQLQALAPKIKEAVGSAKYRELERALYG